MFHSGFHFEPGTDLFILEGREVPILLALAAAALAAEIALSLRQDRRLGLILPGTWLLWTLGTLVRRLIGLGGFAALGEWGRLLAIAFGLENVLTLVLLSAHALCRAYARRRTARQVDRIRIEDL